MLDIFVHMRFEISLFHVLSLLITSHYSDRKNSWCCLLSMKHMPPSGRSQIEVVCKKRCSFTDRSELRRQES